MRRHLAIYFLPLLGRNGQIGCTARIVPNCSAFRKRNPSAGSACRRCQRRSSAPTCLYSGYERIRNDMQLHPRRTREIATSPRERLKCHFTLPNHALYQTNLRLKETPTLLSNLRLLMLPFANSNQFQRLFVSNSWPFECLPSDKNSRPNCILSRPPLETSTLH
jgi:hypothetical protein